MGSMPQLDTSETIRTLTVEIEFRAQTIGDDALPQAMLRVLKRVTESHTGFGSRGFVIE